MKRILVIVFLMAFILVNVSKAQTPIDFTPKQWELKHVCNDTLKSTNTQWVYAVNPKKTDALFYFSNMYISRTLPTDTVNATILIQGKYSGVATDTVYTTLATAYFTGTQTDSIIQFASFTNRAGYKIYRYKVTRNNGSFRIKSNGWLFRK